MLGVCQHLLENELLGLHFWRISLSSLPFHDLRIISAWRHVDYQRLLCMIQRLYALLAALLASLDIFHKDGLDLDLPTFSHYFICLYQERTQVLVLV